MSQNAAADQPIVQGAAHGSSGSQHAMAGPIQKQASASALKKKPAMKASKMEMVKRAAEAASKDDKEDHKKCECNSATIVVFEIRCIVCLFVFFSFF